MTTLMHSTKINDFANQKMSRDSNSFQSCYTELQISAELPRFCPTATAPGDIIVIVFGLEVPFVFCHAEDDRYRVIGEANVHGIMDGEFMGSKYVVEHLEIL